MVPRRGGGPGGDDGNLEQVDFTEGGGDANNIDEGEGVLTIWSTEKGERGGGRG